MPAPEPTDRAEVHKLMKAVEEALVGEMRTRLRNDDPAIPSWQDGPRIGTTPPEPQPGRPPMTQRAVDLNTTILSSSVFVAVLGGAFSAVMWASDHANPTVIKWICICAVAVPVAIAVPVLALKALAKSAKETVEAAPPEHHHHYEAPVYQDQRTIDSRTSGVWVKNNNDQRGEERPQHR